MTKIVVKLLILVAIIALGLFLGPKLIGEKGYVLITLGHWKIELTVISAVMMLLGSYFFVWIMLKLLSTLLALTGISANWLAQFSSRHRQQRFFKGITEAFAGQFSSAEKLLKASAGTEWHGIDWLTLAEIANAKGDSAAQLEYLQAAFKIDDSRLAALKKLADLFKSEANLSLITAYLEQLDDKEKRHSIALTIEAELLASRGEWQSLQEQLQHWKKHLSKTLFEQLSQQAALGVYAEIASKKGANELKNYWRTAPRKYRKDVTHQKAYIELLIQQEMHVEAESELLALQPKVPHPMLLPLFKRLKLHNPTKTMQRLESWLKNDGDNLTLLDAIAQVAFNAGDHELVEKVIRKRLNIEQDRGAQLLLAKTKTAQQELSTAVGLYQQIT